MRDFVARMDARAQERAPQFELMTQLLGRNPDAPLRILDLGAGYGAEAQVFLNAFPNASAVLVDASEEMMRVGAERLAEFDGRYRYVAWDFGEGALPDDLDGPFDAVTLAGRIHHLPEGNPKGSKAGLWATPWRPAAPFLKLSWWVPRYALEAATERAT